jgi:hypothetical protein
MPKRARWCGVRSSAYHLIVRNIAQMRVFLCRVGWGRAGMDSVRNRTVLAPSAGVNQT